MILYKIRFTRQYIVGVTTRLVKVRLQIDGILSEDSNDYPESSGDHKKLPVWERLSAAQRDDRG